MKRYIIYLILFAVSTNIAYSQRIIITNDSLWNHFKKESANEVLAYFIKNFDLSLDLKEAYYDKTLKDSLLRWLDEDVIIKQKINQHKEYLLENFGGEKKKTFTQNYVSYDLKLNFDSIYSDSTLYQSYYNQAILASLDRYQKTSLDKQNELLPPYQVLDLHSLIVYPEAYKKIKYWWYLNNKEEKSLLYQCMLKMNDPEAKLFCDKRLKEFMQSEDQAYPYRLAVPLGQISTANAVKKTDRIIACSNQACSTYVGWHSDSA
jgi:hypothetical protein